MDDARPAASNVPRAEYPRVHPDGRVSFRLRAPDAKKVQVQPGGADNGMGKGPYDMDRGAAKIKLLKQAFEDVEGEIPWSTRKRYDEFDYGYALTVHKAQGSQWNNVVLFDESWAFRDTRERWLYTAVTRAAERLTIVR